MPLFPQEGARFGDIPDFARIDRGDGSAIARAIRILWNLLNEQVAIFDRTSRFGFWTPYIPDAGHFTASAGTWTVPTPYEALSWMGHRRTLTINFALGGTSVSSGLASLRLALPTGYVLATNSFHVIRVVDNGTAQFGLVLGQAGNPYVILVADVNGNGFATSAGNTFVQGCVTVEVQSFSTSLGPT
jgi:hypothetical protein